jgi:hypothetical protein
MRSVLVLILVTFAIRGIVGGQKSDGANANAHIAKQTLKIDDEKDHAMQQTYRFMEARR